MNQAIERVESLKAGFGGGVAAAIGFGAILASQNLLTQVAAAYTAEGNIASLTGLTGFLGLIQAGIAVFSGALFGITYRYVVRNDRNAHLQSGAVGAFGLVRGLAQIEATWMSDPYWLTAFKLLESLLLFAIVAVWLDWAIKQGWILRFNPDASDISNISTTSTEKSPLTSLAEEGH